MSATDDVYLSASELLEAFHAKAISPVEYLEVVIAHVEATEPIINCVADRRYDEARAEAKESAERYAHGTARALDGVPVADQVAPDDVGHRRVVVDRAKDP